MIKKRINGRSKGNSFERTVAGLIIEAFTDLGIEKKDCYRTPLSGGHRFASKQDPGDLLCSKRLSKLFPYAVECKCYKRINWIELLSPLAANKGQFGPWWTQACKAAGTTGKLPLLVFKGNGTKVFCMAWKIDVVPFVTNRLPLIATTTQAGARLLRITTFKNLLDGIHVQEFVERNQRKR
jgi:hypothetical protein